MVFFACGVLQKGMPLFSPQAFSSSRLWLITIAFIGYGSERQSSGSGLGSPDTPSRRSASQENFSSSFLSIGQSVDRPYIDFSVRSSSENRLHVPPQCNADPPTAMVREMMPLAD